MRSAVIVVVWCSMVVSVFAASNNGSITFTGKVTKGTCSTVVVGDSGSHIGSVKMRDVGVGDFTAKDDAKGDTDFKIKLSNCKSSNSSSVKISFIGTPDANNSKVLKNSATSSPAAGVGIGIYNKSNDSLIEIGKDPVAVATLNSGASATKELLFVAKYVATKDLGNITAGPVQANASFTVSYD